MRIYRHKPLNNPFITRKSFLFSSLGCEAIGGRAPGFAHYLDGTKRDVEMFMAESHESCASRGDRNLLRKRRKKLTS